MQTDDPRNSIGCVEPFFGCVRVACFEKRSIPLIFSVKRLKKQHVHLDLSFCVVDKPTSRKQTALFVLSKFKSFLQTVYRFMMLRGPKRVYNEHQQSETTVQDES
jgi:hypothetical protein